MSSAITVPFTGTIPVAGNITFTPPSGPPGGLSGDGMPVIPVGALTTGVLDNYTGQPWKSTHDGDTDVPGQPPKTSTGTTKYIDPVQGRNFHVEYQGKYCGHRFSLWCADDSLSTNWCYDLEVKLGNPDHVNNMELDVNQVLDDGRTVIYDCQCTPDGWEVDAWKATRVKGSPKQWDTRWHRVRIFCSRSTDGDVTNWLGVEFDGVYTNFGYPPGNRALELGWDEKRIVINFQLGSAKDSGTIDAWARNIQVWRW